MWAVFHIILALILYDYLHESRTYLQMCVCGSCNMCGHHFDIDFIGLEAIRPSLGLTYI